MWKFLTLNWGNLASVIGLIFSLLAFIFSKRASNAARKATELVLTRTLSEDMNSASKIGTDIATYVRADKPEIALVRLDELIALNSFIIARWDARLSELSKNRLIKTREQLHIAHDVLGKSIRGKATVKDHEALVRFCREMPTVYVEEYGIAVRTADKQE